MYHTYVGNCVGINECPWLLKMADSANMSDSVREFLVDAQCGYCQGVPFVCCTAPPPTETSTEWPVTPFVKLLQPPFCGIQVTPRIFGGEEVQKEEFPWLAHLGYQSCELEIDYNFIFHPFQCSNPF